MWRFEMIDIILDDHVDESLPRGVGAVRRVTRERTSLNEGRTSNPRTLIGGLGIDSPGLP